MGTSGDKVLYSDICDGYHGVSGKLPQYIAFGMALLLHSAFGMGDWLI